MPDRRLKPEEMRKFLEEKKTRKLRIIALDALLEESTEPSLHDLCLHELHGIAEAQQAYIIKQGRKINALEQRIKALEEKRKSEV